MTEVMTAVQKRRDEELVKDVLGKQVLVVGCGAVGRQVCLMLAAMGFLNVEVVDPDTVDDVNLPVQGWRPGQLGGMKVREMMKDMLACQKPVAEREEVRHGENDWTTNGGPENWWFYPRRFEEGDVEASDVVISCVDSMGVRGQIARAIMKVMAEQPDYSPHVLLDGRCAGETIRVVGCGCEMLEKYMATLVEDSEAFEARCTAKMTLYAANLTAGMLVAALCKWGRGAFGWSGDCSCDFTTMAMSMEDF